MLNIPGRRRRRQPSQLYANATAALGDLLAGGNVNCLTDVQTHPSRLAPHLSKKT